MGKGFFIGSLVVLFVGIGLGIFGYWAGTSSSEKYGNLDCGFNYTSECNTETGGMIVGIGSFIVAAIFMIVGVILSIISGVKLIVDSRRTKSKDVTQV